MKLRDLAPLLRMARHLRTSQLIWRLRRLTSKGIRTAKPPFDHARAALRAEPFPAIPVFHHLGKVGENSMEALERGEFFHLNHQVDLGSESPDWRLGPQSEHRLWTITLHYHEWAYELAEAAVRGKEPAERLYRHYLADWMDRSAATVPGATALAWNPYTVATRIGWWVRSYLALGPRRWQEWSEFHDRFLQNLWQQAAYLEDHLEWDLRGNHLVRDALGLAWAGRFFQDSKADRWLEQAAELISDQIPEQVLPDGGHFERSPMYHLKVMEDLLTAALLLRDDSTINEIRRAWRRMADYVVWVRHPDGEIPLLNDSSFKGACDPETMLELGGQIGARPEMMSPRGGQHFAETGLMVWHGDPWSFFFDVGPIGADCQPGHAHADSLTIEVSFEGQRLIVDPGTHGYDDDERRRYDRSTEAHNTISVAGKDSSEVWDIFRAGRRAVTDQVRADFTNRGALCTARHDGYRFISADLRHERQVRALNSGDLTISDRVTGSGRHDLRGGYLIAPGWSASAEDSGWMLRSGNRGVRVKVDLPDSVRKTEEHRRYHPEFGKELDVVRLGWAGSPRLPAKIQFEMVKA